MSVYQETYPKLFALAYRMTGSVSDAEDAIQEAWARLLDQPAGKVESEPAWLYRTVSNLAIDTLRTAKRTATGYHGPWLPEPISPESYFRGPEAEAILREDLSMALLLMLEHLTPDQRAVWVLRTTLEMSFVEIAEITGQRVENTRQIYRRARQKLDAVPEHAVRPAPPNLAEAFLRTLHAGDTTALIELLSADATWIGDGGGIRPATARPVAGADKVARGLIGLTSRRDGWRVEVAVINGSLGILIYADTGELDSVWTFLSNESHVTHVLTIRNPEKMAGVLPRE
ncbi:MAG: sigma-70 family RNA polymerase sigma factor [Thermomicrobiales bacterium]|nr:sigma-70 family RNA polymerase sigma factor [Thermomicrobiales bacterium]